MSAEAMPGPWARNLHWKADAARLWAMAVGERPRARDRVHEHREHREQRHEHREHRHDRHGPGPGGRGRRGDFRGGPGPFGFGFPGGGPGGFGFPAGPGFGRGPKVGRGDVREALLALLAEEPMHGYQMIRELSERSGGAWRPSPGSVYPVLSLLADEGLVRAEESGGKRVYHLTDAGRAHVEARAGKRRPWDIAADPEEMADLRSVAFQVGAAVVQVARAGNESQVEAATKVLAEAKRSLYRILADDEDLEATGQATGPEATATDAPEADGPAVTDDPDA